MIDDFQEGIATPEETTATTETVEEQVTETPVAETVVETPENVTEIVIPETVTETTAEVVVEKVVETPKPELPELNADAKRIYEALAQVWKTIASHHLLSYSEYQSGNTPA